MSSLLSTALSGKTGRTPRGREEEEEQAEMVPATLHHVPPSVGLYIETERASGEFEPAPETMDFTNIILGLDGADAKATVVVRGLDAAKLTTAGSIGTEHFAHLLEMLHADRRVRIAVPRGADPPVILFQGWPQSRTPSWSERHQSITCAAILEGQELLRTAPEAQITGRRMRRFPLTDPWAWETPDVVTVEALAVVFNAGGKPNMLDQLLPFTDGDEGEGHCVLRAFDSDDADGATYWSYTDALRYVAYHFARAAGVSVAKFMADTDELVEVGPAPHSADPFTRRMTQRVDDVSIHSMNAEEALIVLCSAAGLHFELVTGTATENEETVATYSLRVFAVLEDEADETGSRSRLMGTPTVRDIRRDPPFSDLTARTPADIAVGNEARQVTLDVDSRAITAPVFLGGSIDYEVTLLGRPGWKPHLHLDNIETEAQAGVAQEFWENEFGVGVESRDFDTGLPTSVYHRQHPNHTDADNADVGRLWVFPDTFDYMNADATESEWARDTGPWSSPQWYNPYDAAFEHSTYADARIGGGIPAAIADRWALRPRPFGYLTARKDDGVTQVPPVVAFNYVDTDPFAALANPQNWIKYSGHPAFDKRRAAVWITDDNLLMNPTSRAIAEEEWTAYLLALIGYDLSGEFVGSHFFVSVTCVVRDDLRLFHAPRPAGASVTRDRRKVIDLGGDQFVVRNRSGQNSLLAQRPVLDPTIVLEERDDRAKFEAYCDREADRMVGDAVSGSIEVPWIKTDVRVGDSFSGVTGIGLSFNTYPEVVAVEYVKDPSAGYRTVYHLTDLRHAPEVGSE